MVTPVKNNNIYRKEMNEAEQAENNYPQWMEELLSYSGKYGAGVTLSLVIHQIL